jgi:hypothetical protein
MSHTATFTTHATETSCCLDSRVIFIVERVLICIDLSSFSIKISRIILQCAGSRTDGMPTVDQSDMRGLVTA